MRRCIQCDIALIGYIVSKKAAVQYKDCRISILKKLIRFRDFSMRLTVKIVSSENCRTWNELAKQTCFLPID